MTVPFDSSALGKRIRAAMRQNDWKTFERLVREAVDEENVRRILAS